MVLNLICEKSTVTQNIGKLKKLKKPQALILSHCWRVGSQGWRGLFSLLGLFGLLSLRGWVSFPYTTHDG